MKKNLLLLILCTIIARNSQASQFASDQIIARPVEHNHIPALIDKKDNSITFWLKVITPHGGSQRCRGLTGEILFKLKKQGFPDIILGRVNLYLFSKPTNIKINPNADMKLPYNFSQDIILLNDRWTKITIQNLPDSINNIAILHQKNIRKRDREKIKIAEKINECNLLALEPGSNCSFGEIAGDDKSNTRILFKKCDKEDCKLTFNMALNLCASEPSMPRIQTKVNLDSRNNKIQRLEFLPILTPRPLLPKQPITQQPMQLIQSNRSLQSSTNMVRDITSVVTIEPQISPFIDNLVKNNSDTLLIEQEPRELNFEQLPIIYNISQDLQSTLEQKGLGSFISPLFKTDIYTAIALQLFHDRKLQINSDKLKRFAENAIKNYQLLGLASENMRKLALVQHLAFKYKTNILLKIIGKDFESETPFKTNLNDPLMVITLAKYTIDSIDYYMPTFKLS